MKSALGGKSERGVTPLRVIDLAELGLALRYAGPRVDTLNVKGRERVLGNHLQYGGCSSNEDD